MANAPRWDVGDEVYLDASARIGFLESYKVTNVVRSRQRWLYTINVEQKPPAEPTIGDFIDTYNSDNALLKLLKLMIHKLTAKIELVRTKTGTEDSEFTTLKDRIAAIKSFIAALEEDINKESYSHVGQYLPTTSPTIAGGDI